MDRVILCLLSWLWTPGAALPRALGRAGDLPTGTQVRDLPSQAGSCAESGAQPGPPLSASDLKVNISQAAWRKGSSPFPADNQDAGLVPEQGEQCHTWIQGQVTPVETFLCPTESNHPADIFCCGTCTASYCCSFPKDRLDQTSCSRVMEETENQGAGETSPEDPSSIKNIWLVLIIIGATCLCIWIAFVIFHFRDRTEMILLDNEHPRNGSRASCPSSS